MSDVAVQLNGEARREGLAMTEGVPVRVLLADERQEFRRGLRALLEGHPEVAVVGEARSVASGVMEAERASPDVVVMALRPRDTSVIEASRRIRGLDAVIRVLLLASHRHDEAILSTILAGAAGYVLMDLEASALIRAVNEVGRGGVLLDQRRARRFLDRARAAASARAGARGPALNALEDLLLDMIGDGASDREISQRLVLTPDEVRSRLLRLHARLAGRS